MSSSDDASPPPPMGPPPTAGKTLAGVASPSPDRAQQVHDAVARLDLDYSSGDKVKGRRGGAASPSPSVSVSRSQPKPPDVVAPSNIRQAAATVTPMRMRLSDPLCISAPSDGARPLSPTPFALDEATLRDRGATVDQARHLYHAQVRDVVVRRPNNELELIFVHTRPDGVEMVTREVQTEYTKRHVRLGIVYRSHRMSKLVILIAFVAPWLVIASLVSFYVNWRPLFHVWNGETRGNAAGQDPTGWLLFLCGANFFQFIVTYFCVLPSAYWCLTSDDATTDRRDMISTAFLFCLGFLPVWIGEFGVSDQLPFDKSHEGVWASYIVQYVGGVTWYGCVWYVYSTHMAEVMHAKARRAADEYLYAVQYGQYLSRMKRATAKARAAPSAPAGARSERGGGRAGALGNFFNRMRPGRSLSSVAGPAPSNAAAAETPRDATEMTEHISDGGGGVDRTLSRVSQGTGMVSRTGSQGMGELI